MQQVWLCILSGKRIEETFENTLCGHSGDKTNRYDQCDYACHDSSNLRKHMKVETSQINAISVTMHPLELAIWGDIIMGTAVELLIPEERIQQCGKDAWWLVNHFPWGISRVWFATAMRCNEYQGQVVLDNWQWQVRLYYKMASSRLRMLIVTTRKIHYF